MLKLILIVILSVNLLGNYIEGNSELNTNIIYNKYFKGCNQILEDGIFESCYNFNLKSITASLSTIYGSDLLNKPVINNFIVNEDTRIPLQFRIKRIDYYYSGFIIGLIQAEKLHSYSKETLKLVNVLSNAVPMYSKTRDSYEVLTDREIHLAKKYNFVKVLTAIEYSNETVRGMSIPSKIKKIIYDDNIGYLECYSIKNDNKIYNLEQMKVNCEL